MDSLEKGALPPLIADAIEIITSHESMARLVAVDRQIDGSTDVWVDFDTQLPTRWAMAGISPQGVRKLEQVKIQLQSDYPTSAPVFSLREDFNPNLPHINPFHVGDRIPPCLVAGRDVELLHSDGLYALICQMALWLKNAGRGTLIDLEQGWEPSRRDNLTSHIYADPDHFLNGQHTLGQFQLFKARVAWSDKFDGAYALLQGKWGSATLQPSQIEKLYKSVQQQEHSALGADTLLVVCWPNYLVGGAPATHEHYLPDSVTNIRELGVRAAEFGCDVAFRALTSNINLASAALSATHAIPIFVVFPVKRPSKLIGFTSDFEFIAYVVTARVPSIMNDGSEPVSGAAFILPISEPLLRRTSGLRNDGAQLAVTYLGCGSLGSKLALHAARAGLMPTTLIDPERLAPHNSARHALFPTPFPVKTKAEQLADEFAQFGCKKPRAVSIDIIEADLRSEPLKSAFLGNNQLVVNTTASHAVRQYLIDAQIHARLMESFITDQGRAGICVTEGADRNPNCLDLVAVIYDKLRAIDALASSVGPASSPLQVGVGCNSVTLAMSDDRISLLAAGIAHKIIDAQLNGVGPTGLVSLGRVGDDGMSIVWQHESVGQTHIVSATGLPGWTVRILDTAHRKILADTAAHKDVETGGVIVGRCSPTRREVYVTDVLEAPPDSVRRRDSFVLGTEGLAEGMLQYNATGSNALWCLGTWHSHLQPSGPSGTDMATAHSLEGLLKGAVVLLIRHPDGYAAVVKPGIHC